MRKDQEKTELFFFKLKNKVCSDIPTFRSFGCAKKKKDKGNETNCGKTKETTYFVERYRNRRKMTKTKGEGSKDKWDQ